VLRVLTWQMGLVHALLVQKALIQQLGLAPAPVVLRVLTNLMLVLAAAMFVQQVSILPLGLSPAPVVVRGLSL